MPFIAPIILAAGEGKRIGRPKALLPFGSATLLEHVIDKCARAGFDDPVIVIGAGRKEIQARINLECRRSGGSSEIGGENPGGGAHYIINTNYEHGQTSSIKCGLEVIPGSADGFMIFPVDMPLVTASKCIEMRGAFRTGENIIVAPSFNKKRGHPVIFDISYKNEFLALGDNEPAHGVIRAHEDKIIYIDTDNPWVLFDIDTEKDYENAVNELANRSLRPD